MFTYESSSLICVLVQLFHLSHVAGKSVTIDLVARLAEIKSSLVYFILPISKETSPASILGRVSCDVPSRTCLAGLSALLHKAYCNLFCSRVLRVV
jgi:hypothetical protein